MGAMPSDFEDLQLTALQMGMAIVTDRQRYQRIMAMLQDQTRPLHPRQIGALVSEEGRTREDPRHGRIGRTKTLPQASGN